MLQQINAKCSNKSEQNVPTNWCKIFSPKLETNYSASSVVERDVKMEFCNKGTTVGFS
jgi:hypothetical protein